MTIKIIQKFTSESLNYCKKMRRAKNHKNLKTMTENARSETEAMKQLDVETDVQSKCEIENDT